MNLRDGSMMIFQEATIANITRAYTAIRPHSSVQAQEPGMDTTTNQPWKLDYTTHQLFETCRKKEEIRKELSDSPEGEEPYVWILSQLLLFDPKLPRFFHRLKHMKTEDNPRHIHQKPILIQSILLPC